MGPRVTRALTAGIRELPSGQVQTGEGPGSVERPLPTWSVVPAGSVGGIDPDLRGPQTWLCGLCFSQRLPSAGHYIQADPRRETSGLELHKPAFLGKGAGLWADLGGFPLQQVVAEIEHCPRALRSSLAPYDMPSNPLFSGLVWLQVMKTNSKLH